MNENKNTEQYNCIHWKLFDLYLIIINLYTKLISILSLKLN